eukprot:208445_1
MINRNFKNSQIGESSNDGMGMGMGMGMLEPLMEMDHYDTRELNKDRTSDTNSDVRKAAADINTSSTPTPTSTTPTSTSTPTSASLSNHFGANPLDNVDIMYSILGGQKPPELPLRQECLTNGVELVYNAKGVGQKVVCKVQKKREAILLRRLKLIERKLEQRRSYQKNEKKRKKALDMVKTLRVALEHSASGISYDMYMKELKKNYRRSRGSGALNLNNQGNAADVNDAVGVSAGVSAGAGAGAGAGMDDADSVSTSVSAT